MSIDQTEIVHGVNEQLNKENDDYSKIIGKI